MQETLAVTQHLKHQKHPIVCTLNKYYPHRLPPSHERMLLEEECFVWKSESTTQQGDGYALESAFVLAYQPPKIPGKIAKLFGRKIQERNVSNSISIELIIRNISKDLNILKKIHLGTHLGDNFYFIGDAMGGSFGAYHGGDILLEFHERLNCQLIFGTPMINFGGSLFHGWGIPRSFEGLTQITQPLEDYLRQVLPHLTHATSAYSRELGEDFSQKEAQYFKRHVELIKEYLRIPHQLEQTPLPLSQKGKQSINHQ